MTWQRIDENTYIDDSLVTCAEYQLFLDEMREQGKYYQPDHWTRYQFPDGQAHAPIVGIRPSDAEAFCRWLTTREAEEWSFRLPSIEETEKYFFKKNLVQSPLGYWTSAATASNFAWISPGPQKARNIKFRIAFIRDFDRALAESHDRVRNYILDLNRDVDGNPIFNSTTINKPGNTLVRDLAQAVDIASIRLDNSLLAGELVSANTHAQELKNLRSRVRAIENTLVLDQAIENTRLRVSNNIHVLNRGFVVGLASDLDHIIDIAHRHGRIGYSRHYRDPIPILNRARTIILALLPDQAPTSHSDLALALARVHAINLDLALVLAHQHSINLDSVLDRHHPTLKIDLESIIDTILDRVIARDITYTRILDMYIVLITLRERIAGRSPAFEGIRLVKERK